MSDDQQYKYNGVMGKGAQKHLKAARRVDAEIRNAETPHESTKAHRKGTCACK
jgi:hypothetical protein